MMTEKIVKCSDAYPRRADITTRYTDAGNPLIYTVDVSPGRTSVYDRTIAAVAVAVVLFTVGVVVAVNVSSLLVFAMFAFPATCCLIYWWAAPRGRTVAVAFRCYRTDEDRPLREVVSAWRAAFDRFVTLPDGSDRRRSADLLVGIRATLFDAVSVLADDTLDGAVVEARRRGVQHLAFHGEQVRETERKIAYDALTSCVEQLTQLNDAMATMVSPEWGHSWDERLAVSRRARDAAEKSQATAEQVRVFRSEIARAVDDGHVHRT